jgi:hypothetical protein
MRSFAFAMAASLILAAPATAASVASKVVVADNREFSIKLPTSWTVTPGDAAGKPYVGTFTLMATPLIVGPDNASCSIIADDRPVKFRRGIPDVVASVALDGAKQADIRRVRVGKLLGIRYILRAVGDMPQRPEETKRFLNYFLLGPRRVYTLSFESNVKSFEQNTRTFDAIAKSFTAL